MWNELKLVRTGEWVEAIGVLGLVEWERKREWFCTQPAAATYATGSGQRRNFRLESQALEVAWNVPINKVAEIVGGYGS